MFVTGVTGCASTRAYFVDRGRDAADIFTVSAVEGFGVKARVGPAQIGLLLVHDLAGLKGGELFFNPDLHLMPDKLRLVDIDLLLLNRFITHDGTPCYALEAFVPYNTDCSRDKQYLAMGRFPFYQEMGKSPYITGRCSPGDGPPRNIYHTTQIEAVAALGLGIRLGFNPAELLDFILGWTTLDIVNDDLEARKLKEESNKATGKPVP